jgi:hypothetical protein
MIESPALIELGGKWRQKLPDSLSELRAFRGGRRELVELARKAAEIR